MPERIIYVWNYLEWGGAQMYFLGIARRLKSKKEILFVFPRETGRQFIDFCETFGIAYELIDTRADLGPAPGIVRKIERHLNKINSERILLRFLKKYDLSKTVLHIELTPWQSVLSLVWLTTRRARVFITMHNRLPEVPKWRAGLWKLKFRLIGNFRNFHLFTSNRDAKKSLAPFVSRNFLERISVTYTNVNPDEIAEAAAADISAERLKEKFGLPKNEFLVFCVGQFIDRKGRWIFLEACRALKDMKINFVWISNSNLTPAEQKKIDSFEVGDSFFLLNSDEIGRDHLDLMKFLRLADAFALPSYVEGLPISLLEAMALGVPGISTNITAIPEAIKHLETGLLIEKNDSKALAEAVLKLKNSPPLRERLSKNGRRWVLENFNEKKVAEIALQNYEEAFAQNQQ